MKRFGAAVVLATACACAAAATPPAAELEARYDLFGAGGLAQAPGGWAALHRRTADCELPVVSLTLRAARDSAPDDAAPHVDALRLAAGRCPRYVLAISTPGEVARWCASLAAWGPAQTARELRRRIAAIEADPLLAGSAQGRACRDAYWYELRNTRVVLKRKA